MALQDARAALQAGDLAQAGRLYQQALRNNPRDIRALYEFGVVCLQAQQFVQAENIFAELVRLNPQFADGHCVRGVALVHMDRLRDALACFERALSLRPDSVEAASNYGSALLKLGEHERALRELDRALTLDPRHVFSWNNRGNAFMAMGRVEEAIESYSRALEIEPAFQIALENRDDALFQLRRLSRCPPGFTRKLFDEFSVHYDHTMRSTLAYRGPEILRELAERVMGARGGAPATILDLGCGTGLAAEAFKDLAAGGPIDGIDVSPRMIECARGRGIYRNLVVGDLEREVNAPGPRYDLILAADSLTYLGDLAPCFSGISRRLNSGGKFLFTTEAADGEGWRLSSSNRFQHSSPYLRTEAARCGLVVMAIESCILRYEHGTPVAAFAAAFCKPS
jgi:predicted TPR repeat methyltransferase